MAATQPDLFINGAPFNERQIRKAVGQFSVDWPADRLYLKYYNNHLLDVIHGDSPANTDDVKVKVKFLPIVDNVSDSFVITVPESCRIIDLYWIMYAARVDSLNESYINPLADPDGAPVPFTELVKDHPDLRFVEFDLDYEWIEQQIEAVKAEQEDNNKL